MQDADLTRCLALIEEKLGWGDSAAWSSNDFEELSIRMQDATGHVISATTLKRIWGRVVYASKPSTHSLDTLAMFLGYAAWREFRAAHHEAGPENEDPVGAAPDRSSEDSDEGPAWENPIGSDEQGRTVSDSPQVAAASGKEAFRKKARQPATDRSRPTPSGIPRGIPVLVFSVFMVLLGAAMVLWLGSRTGIEEPASESASAQFASRPVAFDLPNTVVFEYDVSGVQADSFFIQQSWDRRLRKRIEPGNSVHTSTYFYPGYYLAKLIANDEVLLEQPVHIKTPAWNVILEESPVPVYIPDEALVRNGALEVSEAWLDEAGYALRSGNHVLAFYLVQDFGPLRMDNFSMDFVLAHVKSEPMRPCQGAQITIRGEDGMIRFPFDIPGCTGLMHVIGGDVHLNGESTDLTVLGADFATLQHVTLDVRDKEVRIQIGTNPPFTFSYTHDMGKVVGMWFQFSGQGMLDEIQLKDPEGRVVYEEKF